MSDLDESSELRAAHPGARASRPDGRSNDRLAARPAARRALLAALSLLAALLALEIAWRIRSAGFGPTTNPRYVVHDERLGWRYLPGAVRRHRTAAFDVEVAIGPQGFRSQPSLPELAPEVLVLGDSLTFGWGVDDDAVFARLLEQELGVPVWNLGVSGYGTDQQYLLLERPPFEGRLAFALRPSIVLAVYCANDAREVMYAVMYGKDKPVLASEAGEPPRFENLPVPFRWPERVSTLYRSLRRHWIEGTRALFSDFDQEGAARRIATLHGLMREEAERRGATLVLAHQGEAVARASAERNGLLAVDLAPALSAAARRRPVTFGSDPHWNAEGHRVVAEVLAAALLPMLEPGAR